jgi:hypothetical protein
MAISVYDLMPAQDEAAPKPKTKGIPVMSLLKQPEPPIQKPSSPGFMSRSVDAVKAAGHAVKDDPSAAVEAAATALWKGGVQMINLSLSGVSALAKSMIAPVKVDPKLSPQEQAKSNVEQSVASFTSNQRSIQAKLDGVNQAPADKQEEAMMGLLNIIPDGINALGDSVFEKTGSALAATGALSLATVLSLNPGVAGRVLGKIKVPEPSRVSSAFDELAATKPEAAEQIAIHVGQVDPELSSVMKKQIKKVIKASDKELTIIGRNSADATLMEQNQVTKKGQVVGAPTEGVVQDVKKHSEMIDDKPSARPLDSPIQSRKGKPVGASTSGVVSDVQKHAEMLRRQSPENFRLTNERASADLRTAVKEGLEAMEAPERLKYPKTDMSLTKEERAAVRVSTAESRMREEGIEPMAVHQPEILSKRTAEHMGELARRDTKEAGEVKLGGDPDIVYFNSGIPVTREQVAKAFTFTTEHVPGVKIAKAKLERLYQGYIETFNPEAKGPAARTAGAAIASNFFDRAHREHVVWEQGKERRVYWQKMGDQAGMQFIHQFEKGKAFANPLWEKARLAYKNWAEQIYAQDLKTGFTYDAVDHYMPHLFNDGEGVLRFLQKRFGNKWSDPRFIKERGYDLYQEAIDAGFTPKYTNPEDIMQARQHASDIAALRTDLLADFERKGVAVKAAKGADRPPPGYSPNSRRSPTGQRYWVMEELDPLMYNAFDSKSMWENQKLAGSAFRGYMELKNKIVPIKLAASAFHPMHVLHIDAAAALTRETKLLGGKGNIGRFVVQAATNLPYTPGAFYRSLWDNPKTGYPILRTFQGKRDFASLSDSDKAAYKDLAEGGLVPTRPKEETSSSLQRMKDSWHKDQFARAAFHFPFAVLAGLGHLIYNVWIPSLKIASYLKDVKVARELNPDWTPNARQEAFRQIARKVEARYGEMNYNSLFMDKIFKDVGVATNLSLGWNIGLLDQYVGGSIDLGKSMVQPGSFKSKLSSGMLDRPIFASYYIGSALVLGGLMTKFFTGQDPKELIDYTHPLSGEKDQYGKPIRLNTMWYTREFEGLAKHMQQEGTVPGLEDFVINKGSGLVEMSKAAIQGVDGLGQEIRNPNDPAYKQLEQTLAYELGDLNPISLQALNLSPDANKPKMRALSVAGFTPAGKYISNTVIEGKISNDYNKYVRPKEKPFQAVEMSKDMKELRQMFAADDPKYDEKLEAAAGKYDLSDKDIHKIEKLFNSPKEAEFDPSIWMFSHLPWEAQKPLLDKMTPEERENYLPHISKGKRAKYERETAE